MLNLTKLLATSLQSLYQFKDIVSVYQSYLYNDVKPKIDSFITRIEGNISDEDAKLILYDFGFELSLGNGYTNTSKYIQRELKTILKRLKTKGAEISYHYIFYIFDLMGAVYPLIYKPDGTLEPYLNYLISPETNDPPLFLDTGRILDEPYEGDPYWTLDYGSFINSLTRHLLISYTPRFIENANEFISSDTSLAFFNDVFQNKREVEIPHFEFRLYSNASLANIDTIKTWNSYDNSISADQHSIKILGTGDFTTAATIQFGSGSITPATNSITGVQTLIQSYPINTFKIKLKDANHLYFKHRLQGNTKFFDYREIAILDGSGNCIYYTTFPWVRYYNQMLSSTYIFLSTS